MAILLGIDTGGTYTVDEGSTFTLDGSGPATLKPPRLEDWPEITREAGGDAKRVDLDTVTREDVATWKPGDTLLLNGKMLTGRDAAHKRMVDLIEAGEEFGIREIIFWILGDE